MSNNSGPSLMARAWQVILTFFAGVVLIWVALRILSEIWFWLLLIGVCAAVVAVLVFWVRRRADRW